MTRNTVLLTLCIIFLCGSCSAPVAQQADPLPTPSTRKQQLKTTLAAEVESSKQKLEAWRRLHFSKTVTLEVTDATTSEDKLAGWYDTNTGRLFVVAGRSQYFSKSTLLHELHHALQDQIWDLRSFQNNAKTTDHKRALTGMIEGEAMLAVAEIMDYDFEKHMILPTTGTISRERYEKIFSYGIGSRFIKALRQQGGWEAVNNTWLTPPSSTQQLYHPELYLQSKVQRKTTTPIQGKIIESDQRGEFEVRWLMFQHEEFRQQIDRLAINYSYDTWRLIRDDEGNLKEYWDIHFYSQSSANEFKEVCSAICQHDGWSINNELEISPKSILLMRKHKPCCSSAQPG